MAQEQVVEKWSNEDYKIAEVETIEKVIPLA
jgi:hypothetical protein